MNELSLFSGAGGGLLGSKILGWRSVGYVEYEPYCQKILRQRIADGILDPAPIFGDIRKFISEGYAASYTGMVDIITGGFPCQDISIAGKGAGIEGERSGLWKEMSEIIGIVRPRFVFVENSPMLTIRGGVRVIADLTRMGYDTRWGVIGADNVGGIHSRSRLWIIADNEGFDGISRRTNLEAHAQPREFGRNNRRKTPLAYWDEIECPGWGMDDGMADRLDRLHSIGNGQVPLCMAYAFSILSHGIVE